MKFRVVFLFLVFGAGLWSCCEKNKKAGQNPSPMTESIRPHIRVSADTCDGKRVSLEFQDKSARIYIPADFNDGGKTDLIIHFHGIPKVTEFAICNDSDRILVTISGGSGSSSYEKLFPDARAYVELLDRIEGELNAVRFSSVTLSGWSAGYGAIRAILRNNEEMIDNVILLDGLHTSYIPENVVLHQGGKLDSTNLEPFLKFAQKAVAGEKRMIITHSAVFPGTFASTTECTEYLIGRLGLKREPVLKPGPVGMQQLGKIKSGNLQVLSYAGNTAPDHVDHLHGFGYFLKLISE